jgi:hypothetical protein
MKKVILITILICWPGICLLSANEPNKLSVPDPTALATARKLVDDVFKDEYEKAKKSAALLALAKELFQKGTESTDGPAIRFALLCYARDAAAQAGDGPLCFQIINELDRIFEIDAIDMRFELLKILGKSARTPEARKYVIDQALAEFKKAHCSNKFDLAEELIRFAAAEASILREKNTSQLVIACRKELETARKAFASTAASKEILKENPEDPSANLTMGRYLCFVKADWQEGLNYLAKGSDENLAELADRELSNPLNPEAQIALADGWWEQAQSAQNSSKTNLLQHAGLWYAKPLPTLSGLVKLKVEKRLIQIKATCGSPEIAFKAPPSPDSNSVSTGAMPNNINSELRLDRLHGSYKVVGELLITPNGKLLFERGASVLCSPSAKIIVQGEIGSYGEGKEFVTFRREVKDKSWNTIAFPQKNNRIVFEHFDIRGAEIGIYVDKSPLEVKNCVFAQNVQGVKICYKRELSHDFANCLIVNNSKNGVHLELSSINIEHCTIAENGEAGVFMPYYGSSLIKSSVISHNSIGIKSPGEGSELEMHSCNIENNHITIDANAKLKFKCENNYWGMADQLQILASLADSRTKSDVEPVLFEPYEKKALAEAGCINKLPQ